MWRVKHLLPYVGVLVAAVLLTVFESDYLYQVQEQSLFLHTSLFFRQCMVSAGGFLTWIGAYLTQFLYDAKVGAGIICLLWLFLMLLLKLAFRIPARWMPMTLIPIACLLVNMTDLGYWIYYLKLRGHFFDATVGTLVAVLLVWMYRLLPSRYFLRTLFVPLSAAISYPLFGFYGLWAMVLMGVMAWRTDSKRWADSILAILSVAAVPLVCYHALYHETNIVNIYWTTLPVFSHQGERFFAYYLPYILLFASITLMAALYNRERKDANLSRKWQWMQAAVVVATIAAVWIFWYKDENFHCELSMIRSVKKADWDKVLETQKGVKGEPSRAMCMMKNLALLRQMKLGDEMFRYPEGAKRPNAPFPVLMVHTVGKQLYLRLGVPNYCYRWCMEDGVEYGWTVEKLKLMALCSLVNGETAAAQRYFSLLKKTDFQKKWARQFERYIRHPEPMKYDPEMMAICEMMRHDNFLTADMSQAERFLLEHFTTIDSTEPLLQTQILVSALQTKNMQLFWRKLYEFTEMYPGLDVPTHFQEAACLFGHLNNIDVSHMPFDKLVVKDYEDFARTMGECQQRGMNIDQIKSLVYDRFHTTYYYDFYFNRYQYIEQ